MRHLDDDALRARAHELIRALGPNAAARALGVHRVTVLSLAAGAPVQARTFAAVRRRLAAGGDHG